MPETMKPPDPWWKRNIPFVVSTLLWFLTTVGVTSVAYYRLGELETRQATILTDVASLQLGYESLAGRVAANEKAANRAETTQAVVGDLRVAVGELTKQIEGLADRINDLSKHVEEVFRRNR